MRRWYSDVNSFPSDQVRAAYHQPYSDGDSYQPTIHWHNFSWNFATHFSYHRSFWTMKDLSAVQLSDTNVMQLNTALIAALPIRQNSMTNSNTK